MSTLLEVLLTKENLRTSGLIAILWFLLHVYLNGRMKKRKGPMPPGPPSWPIVGSLPYLGSDIREPLRRMTERYGPVITVHLGGVPAVILNSYEVIKEAFSQCGHAFSGRPFNYLLEKYMTYGLGVVETEGKLWQEHRRFTLSVLRDFGFGKPILEEKIREECHNLLHTLTLHANKPYDLRHLLEMSVYNIINSIILGFRSEYNDPMLNLRLESLNRSFYQVYLTIVVPFYHWLIHLVPFDLLGFWACIDLINKVKAEVRQQYEEHSKTLQSGVTRDLMDAYLHEMSKHQDEEDNTFTAEQIQGVVTDLYATGTETTSTMLRWAIIYMLHHPDVQERVQQEIDDVIGQERFPSMKDKLNLPFTDATILEIGRLATIVPLGVSHQTLEDVEFRGYFIPRHTLVMSNLYCVHRDPELWTEPDRFLPDRFLSQNEHPTKNKRDFLIPFCIGKRACLGESLAKMELFLFFTSMMQKFSFRLPPGHPLPSLKGTLGSTSSPHPFEVIVQSRIQ